MTRTFKIITAFAFICVAAPALAHGGGHGGMSRGGDHWSTSQHDNQTSKTMTRTPRQLAEIRKLETLRTQLIVLETKAALANNQVAVQRFKAQLARLNRELKNRFGIVFG